jgi:hypothetical protein
MTVTPASSLRAGRTATAHDNLFLHALMNSFDSVRLRSVINNSLHDRMYSCDSVRLLCC